MSITLSTQHGADTQAKRAASANTRFARAFRAGEMALKGTPHSGDLLLYYKYLVARCGDGASFIETQTKLAAGFGCVVRSVQRYDDHLKALGLIWRRKEGRSYRRTITAYEPEPHDEPPASPVEVAAITDPHALLQAAAERHAAGDEAGGQVLAWQAAMALAAQNAPAESDEEPADDKKISPAKDDRSVMLNTTDRSGTAFKDSDSLISHPASAVCQPHGGDGRTMHRPRRATPIPNTDATRLLQRYGVQSPAALRNHAAAPLERIEHARRRQLELDAGPGMIVQILDDNGLVWKSCGKVVENRPAMPPLDDEDAWRERYIGGELGRYVIGGPTDAPPDDAAAPPEPERYRRDAEHALIDGYVLPALRPMLTPTDAPELEKYRSSLSIPPWMRDNEGGDA